LEDRGLRTRPTVRFDLARPRQLLRPDTMLSGLARQNETEEANRTAPAYQAASHPTSDNTFRSAHLSELGQYLPDGTFGLRRLRCTAGSG